MTRVDCGPAGLRSRTSLRTVELRGGGKGGGFERHACTIHACAPYEKLISRGKFRDCKRPRDADAQKRLMSALAKNRYRRW